MPYLQYMGFLVFRQKVFLIISVLIFSIHYQYKNNGVRIASYVLNEIDGQASSFSYLSG